MRNEIKTNGMRTIELAKDLKITILKEAKVCLIDIDNPDWNWMNKQLGGKTTMQIDRKDLFHADKKFFRNLIENSYQENKGFILEAKLNSFRAY